MTMNTMCLPRMLGDHTVTTEGVLALCYRFEMGWIDAGVVTTEMIELEPFGDRADQQLISEAMGEDLALLSSNSKPTVAQRFGCQPRPTGVWPSTTVNFCPEAFLQPFITALTNKFEIARIAAEPRLITGCNMAANASVVEHQEASLSGVMGRAVSAAPSSYFKADQ